ncbi:membrane steroid-binding protein 2-like [Ziziphus jujuba]|uniref:Membrane steroid-binding protein 2-like n=1 Tax=Ziziphus jujuba TaxID=326968 RepID=A0ABM3I667_ZIZJJ|nr:membrane steroid-binding protein 2-like [Ziziphus jujuba]
MGIYSEVMEEITWYTGLSPAAFFTIAAMMVVVYKTVTSMFVSPEDFNKPPVAMSLNGDVSSSQFLNNYLGPKTNNTNQPPLQLGDLTDEQLRAYDGSDPDKPLLISIKGQIYDVSSGRNFYGRGGPYAMFAGREASRALALLSFKPDDINGNLEDLGPEELQILEDWEFKFIEKYPKVGRLLNLHGNENVTTTTTTSNGTD